jgi:hypothetical protein
MSRRQRHADISELSDSHSKKGRIAVWVCW